MKVGDNRSDVPTDDDIICEINHAEASGPKKCTLRRLRDEPEGPLGLRCGKHRAKCGRCYMQRLSANLMETF